MDVDVDTFFAKKDKKKKKKKYATTTDSLAKALEVGPCHVTAWRQLAS